MRRRRKPVCMGDLKKKMGPEWSRREFLAGLSRGMSLLYAPTFIDLALASHVARAEGISPWTPICTVTHLHGAGGSAGPPMPARLGPNTPITPAMAKFYGYPDAVMAAANLENFGGGWPMFKDEGLGFNLRFFTHVKAPVFPDSTNRVKIRPFVFQTDAPDDNVPGSQCGILPLLTAFGGETSLLTSQGLTSANNNGIGVTSPVPNASSSYQNVQNGNAILRFADALQVSLGAGVSPSQGTIDALAAGLERVTKGQMAARLNNSDQHSLMRDILGKNYDTIANTSVSQFSQDQMNVSNDLLLAPIFGFATPVSNATLGQSTNFSDLYALATAASVRGRIPFFGTRTQVNRDDHGDSFTTIVARNQAHADDMGRWTQAAGTMVLNGGPQHHVLFYTSDGSAAPDPADNRNNPNRNTNVFQNDQNEYTQWCGIYVGTLEIGSVGFGTVNAGNGRTADTLYTNQKNAFGAMAAIALRLNGQSGLVYQALKRLLLAEDDITQIMADTAMFAV